MTMPNTLDIANYYVQKQGFSLIPLLGKIPDASVLPKEPDEKGELKATWKPYQSRKPTPEELQKWFGNGVKRNIGIVTGSISGIAVVDLDTPEAVQIAKDLELQDTPVVKTGKGYHLYYQYRAGIRNFQKRDDLPGIDLRGDGGYVVAPPSIHTSGAQYAWVDGKKLGRIPLAEFPEIILAKHGNNSHKTPVKELYKGATEGSRNDMLARLAGSWVRADLSLEDCLENAYTWNTRNNPPLPEREVEQTVESIWNTHQKKQEVVNKIPFADAIKDWINEHDGEILLQEIYRDFHLNDPNSKTKVRKIISKMVQDNILEPDKKKSGCYRKKDTIAGVIDWENADLTEVPISYPLGLEKLFVTLRKTIVVVAGVSDAGKSAFLLHCAALNAGRGMPIKYFSSEMGDAELRFRIDRTDIPKDVWRGIDFRERFDNFADAIEPDAINIVDYIEIFENAYMIGKHIKDIFDKLKTGIALIAIQKDPKKEFGIGASYSMHKSRLYVNIDYEKMTIKKLKNKRHMEINTRDMSRTFKIERGLLVPDSEWQH